jgi:lysophospholipid acyltransferase (LPLAT)-like uncharacterized protein
MSTGMKRRIISSPVFSWFVARLICAYSRTFRLTVRNEQPWREHLARGGSVILCSWHQQFFSFVRHFRGYRAFRPALMISQSADGSLIAGVARRMGWQTVRGSSSRDGFKAMLGMIRHVRDHHLGAHIVDGPRGPAGVIKKGVIHMARETGAALVPVYAEAERAWRFRSWDRFFVPKPFSRVCIRFGDIVELPPAEDPAEFETQRAHLETIMRPGLGK